MRLIDADALMQWLQSPTGFRTNCEDCTSIDCLDCIIEEAIANSPTIDAEPVRHGRWVDHMVRDWRCSECGKRVPKQVRFDGYCYNDKLAYCPNCGAKMEARSNETD